jgi:hypothetical protein
MAQFPQITLEQWRKIFQGSNPPTERAKKLLQAQKEGRPLGTLDLWCIQAYLETQNPH